MTRSTWTSTASWHSAWTVPQTHPAPAASKAPSTASPRNLPVEISGLAVEHYNSAAAEFSHRYVGSYLGKRELRSLVTPRLRLYEDPKSRTCNHDTAVRAEIARLDDGAEAVLDPCSIAAGEQQR